MPFYSNASARCFDALRLLNMTEEKISVIPSVAEESRENEFFLIPRDGDFFYLSFTPRGLGSAVLQQRFREMNRRRFACST